MRAEAVFFFTGISGPVILYSMKKQPERFDMTRPPVRTRQVLRPLTYLLSVPDVLKHKAVIRKTGTEGLRPPYIMLCNHNAFLDFKVATKAIYPDRANYIVAIDGFIGREELLRQVGCICKRKFTDDVALLRNMRKVIQNGDVLMIYPEARYSLCGTTAVLPSSLGKLCKLFGVPVVTLICHGHHINSPFWNLRDRGVSPVESEMKLLFTPEMLKVTPASELSRRIVEAFQYDEYAWQKERGIRIDKPWRAEGLHKVLYQCRGCGAQYRMATKGTKLFCRSCGASWTMSELGELVPDGGGLTDPGNGVASPGTASPGAPSGIVRIPEWYEWERENVKAEVENGTYSSGELAVHVDSLPNAKRFIRLGEGTLVHDMDGFTVSGTDTDGDPFFMHKTVPSLYSCHIEYDYLGKFGDCIDLNTLEDTWYIYPHGEDFSVTKMALATEELYFRHCREAGRPCPPGLA